MSRRYTPGPWEASEGYPSDIWHVDMPSRGYSVVVSRGEEDWDMPVEEVQANARLIAAAPDLLAALERIAWTECGAFSVQIARDAIVKAKGGG